MNKKFAGFIVSCFLHLIIFGQNITGEWYGVGIVKRKETNSDYLSELVLRQKGKLVTGEFNYFFKSVTVSTKVTGLYDDRTRTFQLKIHPLLNFMAYNLDGADCPMEGTFTLQVSRVETSLKGQFTPVKDYRYTCPPISVKLVKYIQKPGENRPTDKGEPERVVEETAVIPVPVPGVDTNVNLKPDPDQKLVEELNKRTFETTPVIEVNSDSLRLTLYDNGEVDGDTISLFYNRKLVQAHKLLSDKPFSVTVPLDTSINEISMFAENLGSIPPNTAVCVIYAGEERFELSMLSTFIKNATLRFRKKSKATK